MDKLTTGTAGMGVQAGDLLHSATVYRLGLGEHPVFVVLVSSRVATPQAQQSVALGQVLPSRCEWGPRGHKSPPAIHSSHFSVCMSSLYPPHGKQPHQPVFFLGNRQQERRSPPWRPLAQELGRLKAQPPRHRPWVRAREARGVCARPLSVGELEP